MLEIFLREELMNKKFGLYIVLALLFCFLGNRTYSHIVHTLILEHPVTHKQILLYGDLHLWGGAQSQAQITEITQKLDTLCMSESYKNKQVAILFEGFNAYDSYKLLSQEPEGVEREPLFVTLYQKNAENKLGFIDIDNRYFVSKFQRIALKLGNYLINYSEKNKTLPQEDQQAIKELFAAAKDEIVDYYTVLQNNQEYKNIISATKSTQLVEARIKRIDALLTELSSRTINNQDEIKRYINFIDILKIELAIGLDFNCLYEIFKDKNAHYSIVFAGINHTVYIAQCLMHLGYVIKYDSSYFNDTLKQVVEIIKVVVKDHTFLGKDSTIAKACFEAQLKCIKEIDSIQEFNFITNAQDQALMDRYYAQLTKVPTTEGELVARVRKLAVNTL